MSVDARYEPRTDWRNIGVFRHWFTVGLMTPWGNLIVKRWEDRLFSERYGYQRTLRLFGLCVTWVRLKRLRTDHPL